MQTLTAEQFSAEPGLDDWRADADVATASFVTHDFAAGVRLIAAIAEVAEAANHHPDIDLRYRGVTVRVTTHSAGGLTHRDVDLARRITGVARDLGVAADLSRLDGG